MFTSFYSATVLLQLLFQHSHPEYFPNKPAETGLRYVMEAEAMQELEEEFGPQEEYGTTIRMGLQFEDPHFIYRRDPVRCPNNQPAFFKRIIEKQEKYAALFYDQEGNTEQLMHRSFGREILKKGYFRPLITVSSYLYGLQITFF